MTHFLKNRCLLITLKSWVIACLFLNFGTIHAREMWQDLHYYLSIYSHDDGVLNLPRNAHSFAGFMAFDQATGQVIERFAISWLPLDGSVCAFGGIERGRNFTLSATFSAARSRRLDIMRFGPREIGLDFFLRAKSQWQKFEQATFDGSILYKAIDSDLRFRAEYPVVNCMHAVAGIIGELEFGRLRGRLASSEIDRFFAEYYLSFSAPAQVFQAFLNFENGY
jgi:hypothetical protein